MTQQQTPPPFPTRQLLPLLCLLIGLLIFLWSQGRETFWTQYTWKPYITSIEYSLNDEAPREIRLAAESPDSNPTILFEPGDKLVIRKINYALLPSCYMFGARVIKLKDNDDIPKPENHPRVRFRSAIRKNWGVNPESEWFGKDDEHVTRWCEVDAGTREINDLGAGWQLEKLWDIIRIQVEVEGRESHEQSAETPVVLKTRNGQGAWNVRHNIFNTLMVEHTRAVLGVGVALLVLFVAVVVGGMYRARASRSP